MPRSGRLMTLDPQVGGKAAHGTAGNVARLTAKWGKQCDNTTKTSPTEKVHGADKSDLNTAGPRDPPYSDGQTPQVPAAMGCKATKPDRLGVAPSEADATVPVGCFFFSFSPCYSGTRSGAAGWLRISTPVEGGAGSCPSCSPPSATLSTLLMFTY